MTSYVLSIDQGTTSPRASLFRADTSVAAFAQQEFPQHFPADGEVEHEPSLGLAYRIAAQFGLPVEAVFENPNRPARR